MNEIEEVQEQMKADMEAILSMKKIMESNAAAVATTSAAIEVDPTHPLGLNHVNPLVSDMVGQGGEALGSTGSMHHPMLYRCPMRMSTTLLLFPLKASNPSWGMHILLSPWGGGGRRRTPRPCSVRLRALPRTCH